MEAETSIEEMIRFFEDVEDPRRDHPTKFHPLESIIIIAVLAVICGADGWKGIWLWADGREDWLEEWLPLPHGLPSKDTIRRVFSLVEPAQFGRAFRKWTESLARVHEEMVALDGKTLCGSGSDKEDCVHIINAWAAQNELVLAQLPVDDESNEIPALNRMIRLLDVQGVLVTIDAIGCQTDMAKVITDRGGDYLLRVKANQENLHDEIRHVFDWALDEERPTDQPVELGYAERTDSGHGRIEKRRCWVTEQLDGLAKLQSWPDIQGVVKVETERHLDDEVQTQTKYYVTSEAAESANDADYLLASTRRHWEIENKVHWVLDMAFSEDQSRVRNRNAAANLSAMRKMAKNLLDQESSLSAGLENKRLRAASDPDYLIKVLKGITDLE